MIVYFDTSSLVKLYVEADSERVRGIGRQCCHYLNLKDSLRRKQGLLLQESKEDGFSNKTLQNIVEDLNRDWESYFVIEITDGLIRSAGGLAEKHLLRGFDSIHLASAINFRSKIKSEGVLFKQ